MRLLILSLLLTPTAFGQLFGWDSNITIPGLGRDDAVCFTFDRIVYFGMGNHAGFSESNIFYGYNTRNGEWVDVPAFPGTPRQYATVQTINEKAFIVGGVDAANNPLNEVWEFDMADQVWSQKNNANFDARWAMASFTIADEIYVGTGRDTISYFNDFWKYDSQQDSWIQVANFPLAPRFETIGFALHGKGYCGLGKDSAGTLQSDLWQYDPNIDLWVQKENYPAGARWYAKAEVLNGSAYVGSGEDENGQMRYEFYRYNPAHENWTQVESVPLPARRGVASCSIPFYGIFWASGLDDSFQRLSVISRYTLRISNKTSMGVFFHELNKQVFVTNLPGPFVVRVFDLQGKLKLKSDGGEDHFSFDTSDWAKGMYVVTCYDQSAKFMLR
ncbi:MAG: T9SS type A sorting domain-containing protein [Crocinitomicaceae bacterium]